MAPNLPCLVCMGNLTIDDVYLQDGTFMPDCTGGDALYAALAAKLWEPDVQIVAPAGNDLSEQIRETIQMAGFDFTGETPPIELEIRLDRHM